PAPLAAAGRADRPLEQLFEPEGRGDLLDVRLDAPGVGVDLEVPAGREAPVEDLLLEDDAALRPRGERLGRDVVAGEPRAAARRPDGRRQHPDRGRLAGAVRAEKPEDLAG